jgi:hypothetical protein
VTAANVLQGRDADLSDREAALVRWSRQVVHDPNATTEADVDRLRQAGLRPASLAGRIAFPTQRSDSQCRRPPASASRQAAVEPKWTVSPLTVRVIWTSRARPTRSSRSRVGVDPPASTRAIAD